MLTKEESLLNRQYSPNDFKGINVVSVIDLTTWNLALMVAG